MDRRHARAGHAHRTLNGFREAAISVRLFVGGLAGVLALLAGAAPMTAQDPSWAEPGPEHEMLGTLLGEWYVFDQPRGESPVGIAEGRSILDGRFVVLELDLNAGPVRSSVYHFGFDRRNERFTVFMMDNTGTYGVLGQGVQQGTEIAMYGVDDDPHMASLGITKEFVIGLTPISDDRASIAIRFIDNRTDARTEIPFLAYELRRMTGAQQ